MTTWISLVIGLVLGGLGAWLAANSKTKGIVSELRAQLPSLQNALQRKEQEVSGLQQEIRKEGELKVAAQTKLDEVRARLDEEQRTFSGRRKEPSECL